jgi:hypothetical protein
MSLTAVDPNAYFAALGAVALGGYLVASSFTQLINRQEEYMQVCACVCVRVRALTMALEIWRRREPVSPGTGRPTVQPAERHADCLAGGLCGNHQPHHGLEVVLHCHVFVCRCGRGCDRGTAQGTSTASTTASGFHAPQSMLTQNH